jgi:hypothetical protein
VSQLPTNKEASAVGEKHTLEIPSPGGAFRTTSIVTMRVFMMLSAFAVVYGFSGKRFGGQGSALARVAQLQKGDIITRSSSDVSRSGDRSSSSSSSGRNECTRLRSTPVGAEEDGKFDLGAWFNPNTRGGVIVWSILLLAAPIGVYNYLVSTGLEDTKVGGYVGAIFVLLSNLLWASTYIFRVANKDMTYAKQLRDYENAVLQKRLEELADDEIEALMDEISAEEESVGDAKKED